MGKIFCPIFCGKSSYTLVNFDALFRAIINPKSCMNHIIVISIDVLLLLTCSFIIISTFKAPNTIKKKAASSALRKSSAAVNTLLSLAYLVLGVWTLDDKIRSRKTVLPLHGWLVLPFQGLTWLFLSLTLSFKRSLSASFTITKLCAVLCCLYATFMFMITVFEVVVSRRVKSGKVIVDVLLLPGAALLLFCAFEKHADDPESESESESYIPLQSSEDDNQTPFSEAGFLSRMSFWWLNPLMKKGKQKILEDEDIPKLRSADQAETCYRDFLEKHKRSASILPAILSWQWRGIIASGAFALVKVLTLSTGPLFLKAFIELAQGKKAFKYEGYAITFMLFFTKCLESLSERQWCFRTRLIGLQIRSMLSAAIYAKQFRLSNDAKISHTSGEIVNYVTVDAYRIGEFPFWLHQIWTVILQMCIALVIIYSCVGNATIAALVIVVLSLLLNSPLGKLQHKYQTKLMAEQDKRIGAITEALVTMKVLKVYAWENHFKKGIENLRESELRSLAAVLLQKGGYYMILFWSFPILVSITTFGACCFLGIALDAGNVFTFLATLRIVQEPVRLIPDVAAAYIQASVSLDRIVKFLNAAELQNQHVHQMKKERELQKSIDIQSKVISWGCSLKPTLRNVNLLVKPGEKIAICGEVGAGKSTLLAAILGEVPNINGTVEVHGKLAYVSQTAWIQTGTIQDNILFGSSMDHQRYQDTLERCSLLKDIDMLPFGDLTVIGERGVNLSGGQKQRVQLARALYQDADIYLLDDPFSAVDAHTASNLFNQYIVGALTEKTVLLVTHQVDFLPTFDCILLMVEGEIVKSGTYDQLMTSSLDFHNLVNAHNDVIQSNECREDASVHSKSPKTEIMNFFSEEDVHPNVGEQLIQKEEREGDNGFKPYIEYLSHGKGFLYSSLAVLAHIFFLLGQSIQSYWLASNVQNSIVSDFRLVTVYSVIGCSVTLFLLLRSFSIVSLGLGASRSIFSTLLNSLFRAPMSFFDATPVGRILSRVSSDVSIIDLDVALMISMTLASALTAFFSFGILAIVTWQVLLVIVPMVYLTIILQQYYFASAKELMRINGTTKSTVASNLAEAISGASTIRAFGKEDQYFSKAVELIDMNASPFFHSFSSNEWLIQRLEMLCAVILSCSALALTLLPSSEANSGFIGMALSYGLSLNIYLVSSVQNQCMLSNLIISAERLGQYMYIPEEAREIIPENRPPPNWPAVGRIQIFDLKVRYNGPLVLQGINCIFEGGNKIGIVGRTGSGKTTLISTLFRLVEPSEGKIIIDGIDICTIGLHDVRSRLSIIPQDPTLFSGSVRHNLDPLSQHTDQEILQVLEKCQLRDAVQDKEGGLDSLVVQDGSNWSMGQRQLFCLGRALLKRRKILVLDEATASIDNTTDAVLQKTIRTEFADCTVVTVAHRIPTVMDCTRVLVVSDGKVAEFDEPTKLINKEGSLFGKLVREYWSYTDNASMYKD